MSGQPLQFLLLLFAGWVNRRQLEVIDYLKEESRVLREQLHGRRLRFTDDQRPRLAVRGKVLGRRVLSDVTRLLTPDTILRWHRQLIAAQYDGTAKRGPGRPSTAQSIEDLVVKFAKENAGWGYTRLRDALGNLGHVICRNTIKRSRPIVYARVPQSASRRRHRMCQLPAHSPNLNAYAERFVLSIKSECLNKLVLLGEQHLRRAGSEFVEHYHLERNHQGLEHRLLTAATPPSNDTAPMVRRERLGGILNYYYRSAA